MGKPACTDEEFIELFKTKGPRGLAQFLAIDERNVLRRRRRLEDRLGIKLYPPAVFNKDTAPPKILMLDIETSPNVAATWGLWNQNVALSQLISPGYTLCWAAKWIDEKKMAFCSIRSGLDTMLTGIHKMMSDADIIVHYNGLKFDIPTLNQEFLAHGLNPPAPSVQIDLLRTVRNRFRLQSNKLDYVARHLGLEGKLKHKGMELWRGCMDGDDASWKTMEVYNKQDVKLLEKVYVAMIPWISNHPSHALFNESLNRVCPNCGSMNINKRGIYYTKTQAYQRLQCTDCGGWSRERSTMLDKDKRASVLAAV